MSQSGHCVETVSKKHKSVDVEEVAKQYYLLAKATMADRNVSSIYRIHLGDLARNEFAGVAGRFRRKIDSLVHDEGLEAVVLSGRDLSTEDRNELIQLADNDRRNSGSRRSEISKKDANEIYFQLQRARVP